MLETARPPSSASRPLRPTQAPPLREILTVPTCSTTTRPPSTHSEMPSQNQNPCSPLAQTLKPVIAKPSVTKISASMPLRRPFMEPNTTTHGSLQQLQLQHLHARPPARRSSAIGVSVARRLSLLPPPTQHPQPMLTRRGSLMLTATMRAMGESVSPATLAALAVSAPSQVDPHTHAPPCRRKSNQEDDHETSDESDSDSEDESTSPHRESNQIHKEMSSAPMRSSPPPPYFRLATFMLEDHDATPPTSPSACSTRTPTPDTTSSPPTTTATTTSPRRATTTTPCKAAQIDAIFREIWQTEESYVAALRGLVTQFFEPLQAFAKIHAIELGAMAALHHSTSTILSIHDELLRQLEPLHNNEPPVPPPGSSTNDPFGVGFTGTLARLHQLSRAFLSTIEYMKVYAFYCGSYLSAKQELERLQREHPKLAEFTAQLNECARRGSQEEEIELPPLDINSSLIKPVQRICRYPLLFKNLLSNATGPEETLVLQQSLQKIEAVSNYVNEKVRESQNNARLYQLHQMLHPSSGLELLQPSRTLLHETWANVTSLDALRWPAKLLKHFRRRRHRHNRRRSSIPSQLHPAARDDWFRLSVFGLGDDRRSSATITATSMRSPASTRFGASSGTGGSDRHTSFSAASTTTQYPSSPGTSTQYTLPARLQRRRSSGGERSRLILLSDMLLMAKLREQKLKIRRQICLSCAVIHDDMLTPPTPPPPPAPRDDAAEDELLPPMSTAIATAIEDENASYSFTLEVSKVGRCSCHHLSPLTLKRSPKLRSLSAFLNGRRSSDSFTSSSGDLFQALQQQQQLDDEQQRPSDLTRVPSLHRINSRTGKLSGSRFRYLEQLAGFRSVKRYRVTCDTVQEKTKFLKALRLAIARSARLQALGGGGNGSSSELALSRVATSTGANAVAIAVSLPFRIWRSIRSTSGSSTVSQSTGGASAASHSNLHAVPATSSSDVEREADLLHLNDSEAEVNPEVGRPIEVNVA